MQNIKTFASAFESHMSLASSVSQTLMDMRSGKESDDLGRSVSAGRNIFKMLHTTVPLVSF